MTILYINHLTGIKHSKTHCAETRNGHRFLISNLNNCQFFYTGQIMIPRQICQHQHWESEQELVIIVLMKMKFAIEV
jgi:DNA-binding transcriptional regulator/RsmH inhibitor MraZ